MLKDAKGHQVWQGSDEKLMYTKMKQQRLHDMGHQVFRQQSVVDLYIRRMTLGPFPCAPLLPSARSPHPDYLASTHVLWFQGHQGRRW